MKSEIPKTQLQTVPTRGNVGKCVRKPMWSDGELSENPRSRRNMHRAWGGRVRKRSPHLQRWRQEVKAQERAKVGEVCRR